MPAPPPDRSSRRLSADQDEAKVLSSSKSAHPRLLRQFGTSPGSHLSISLGLLSISFTVGGPMIVTLGVLILACSYGFMISAISTATRKVGTPHFQRIAYYGIVTICFALVAFLQIRGTASDRQTDNISYEEITRHYSGAGHDGAGKIQLEIPPAWPSGTALSKLSFDVCVNYLTDSPLGSSPEEKQESSISGQKTIFSIPTILRQEAEDLCDKIYRHRSGDQSTP